MTLTERLAAVTDNVQKLKESLTYIKPGDTGAAVEKGETLIRSRGREWDRRVAEAAAIFADVMAGRRPQYHLREAMTTSDFPLLFGDLLNRQLLGNYATWPATYPAYFKIVEVNDFRTLHLYTMEGGNGILDKVAERAPYPETNFTTGQYSLAVAKYGRRYSIDFEMVINDDLNAFQDRPQQMAVGARRSEEYLATQMMADTNGPHASFFTSGNANIVTSNPALSILALQTALTQLASKKDSAGNPIFIEMVTLVVPPALEIIARNILNATQLWITGATGGATSEQQLVVNNWLQNRLKLVVNPYLPIVTTSGTKGNTSWYLVGSTSSSPIPAFIFGFMRGRRRPQLFVKDPDAIPLGGGNPVPSEGSFDNDAIDYKIRHIFGAAQGDPKMAMASAGQ